MVNINEAFTGVRINAKDATKISAIVKPATRSGNLTGFAESLYSQWEDEFTSTDEMLNRLNESSNDEMKDWGLNRAEYQRVVKEVLSIGLKEFNESQVNESKAFKDYDAAYKEASKLAKQVDKDYGLEFNKSTKEYVIFMLPKEQNRTGHELTCQVVTKNESRVDEAGFEVGANLEKLRKEYVQKFYAGSNLVTVVRSKNGKTVVYMYESNSTYCAVIYTRSVRKPTAFKTAKTQPALQLILKEFIINNDKLSPLTPPSSAAHGVQVGQIFHIGWGYSMILNDFYQVVSLPSAKMAIVQRLHKDTTGTHPGMHQTPNMKPDGQPFRVKLNVRGDKAYFKTEYGYASAWDGKPKYYDNYD